MKRENFEKINKNLPNSVEQLLIRTGFEFSITFLGIKEPTLLQRKVKTSEGYDTVEFLTLIPIYNLSKDEGEKVWDYRGTIMSDVRGKFLETQFKLRITSITQLFDYLEEDIW